MKNAAKLLFALVTVLLLCAGLIACAHKEIEDHTATGQWLSDESNHWHACEKEKCEDAGDRAPHVYDNACDPDCNVCERNRVPAAHVYDNGCDTTCNVCSATRTVDPHKYDNACDTSCNVCSATRTVDPHKYDNACDTSCNVCGATRTVEPHKYDNACDTSCNVCGATRTVTHDHAEELTAGDGTHYYLCSVCSDRKDETAHVFNKEVAEEKFLKAAATDTTKAQYWKSCVCGAKSATEYFETDKIAATLTNIQDLSKTYDKTAPANPTYTTNSDGAASFEWYQGETKLGAKPVNAGTYKVKVIVAETATYAGVSAEREFTIAPKDLDVSGISFTKEYDGTALIARQIPGLVGDEQLELRIYMRTPSGSSDSANVTAVGGRVLWSCTYGANQNNYTFGGKTPDEYAEEMRAAAKIEKRKLNITLTECTKEYDGTTKFYITLDNTNSDYDSSWLNGKSLVYYQSINTANAGTYPDNARLSYGLYYSDNLNNNLSSNFDFTRANVTFTITPKTITLDASASYTAEYNGTSSFTVDISDLAVNNETLSMSVTATKTVTTIPLPVKVAGDHENVTFGKIKSTNANYEIENETLSGITFEVTKRKLTNLDLKVTEATYNSGKITLLAKDGIVGEDNVVITITTDNYLTVGGEAYLVLSASSTGPGCEVIAFESGSDNYELVLGTDRSAGTVTIVANCDVQFDGSCNCGTSHLTETLTFTGGEDVGKSATIACDSTYEGGIYKIALEGGRYEFLGSDQFFNISGIYDEDGQVLATGIGTYTLPAGTYYFHVYVGSSPYSDTIWVKKVDCVDVKLDGSCACGNTHVAATSFENAYVIDCQEEERYLLSCESTRRIYLKVMGGENSLMNDFYVSTPDGSTATFTYECYRLDNTSEPYYMEESSVDVFYKDVCDTSDEYVVITIVAAGDIVVEVG